MSWSKNFLVLGLFLACLGIAYYLDSAEVGSENQALMPMDKESRPVGVKLENATWIRKGNKWLLSETRGPLASWIQREFWEHWKNLKIVEATNGPPEVSKAFDVEFLFEKNKKIEFRFYPHNPISGVYYVERKIENVTENFIIEDETIFTGLFLSEKDAREKKARFFYQLHTMENHKYAESRIFPDDLLSFSSVRIEIPNRKTFSLDFQNFQTNPSAPATFHYKESSFKLFAKLLQETHFDGKTQKAPSSQLEPLGTFSFYRNTIKTETLKLWGTPHGRWITTSRYPNDYFSMPKLPLFVFAARLNTFWDHRVPQLEHISQMTLFKDTENFEFKTLRSNWQTALQEIFLEGQAAERLESREINPLFGVKTFSGKFSVALVGKHLFIKNYQSKTSYCFRNQWELSSDIKQRPKQVGQL